MDVPFVYGTAQQNGTMPMQERANSNTEHEMGVHGSKLADTGSRAKMGT